MKPAQAEGIVSKELTDGTGHHFILKNPRRHTYARLVPEEFWLWQRMDGVHTVEQLVMEYFMEFHAFAFAAVAGLMARLRAVSMLVEPPGHLYGDISRQLTERTLAHRLALPARLAFTKEFVIKGLDGHLERIHRYGGWVIFTLPVQILFVLIALGGLVAFGFLANDPRYHILEGGLGGALLKLGLLAYIPLVIHEFGHAITAKHFGCEVYKGGVMLYYGLPAAFVDTTDVWMQGKRARLAVTWAGPYTGYLIAGACSLLVLAFPDLPRATTLLQVALVSIFINTFNLLPALKLDGYYLLADSLEIPGLHERSIDFLANRLRQKLSRREAWSREEWVFLGFGILAIASIIYFTRQALAFWDAQASHGIAALLEQRGDLRAMAVNAGVTLLAISAVVYLMSTIYRRLAQVPGKLRRSGVLSTRGRTALFIIVACIVLTVQPVLLLRTLGPWVIIGGGVLTFALAAWLALSTYTALRGSVHAVMWLVAAAGFVAGAAVYMAASDPELALGLSVGGLILAVSGLLLGGRLLSGLGGSWRAFSIGLIAFGLVVWAAAFFPLPIVSHAQVLTLAGLLIVGGQLHWRMRPPTVPAELGAADQQTPASTRARIVAAYQQIWDTILSELEADLGAKTRRRVEAGDYRKMRLLGRRKKEAQKGDTWVNATMAGLTPNDYGSALALKLEELLVGVEKAGGRSYARRALAHGYDRLDWELHELAEDYLLKYVHYAAGLSSHLADARNDTLDLARKVPIFAGMSEAEFARLAREFKSRRFERGESIVREGDPGDSFHVVRLGRVEVLKQGRAGAHSLNQLGRGQYFGEAALLSGAPRNATIRALTPVETLSLSRADFERLAPKDFDSHGNLHATMRHRTILQHVPLFAQFDTRELDVLAGKLERREVAEGQTVFHYGEQGDRFYIIESGKVSVRVPGSGNNGGSELVERATLGTGEYFGEIALMLNVPRTATIVALQPTALLALKAADFNRLLAESTGMKQAIERASSGRVLSNRRWQEQSNLRQAEAAS
jgi:putative peptide zinc metalloprotease protein